MYENPQQDGSCWGKHIVFGDTRLNNKTFGEWLLGKNQFCCIHNLHAVRPASLAFATAIFTMEP